MTTRDLDQAKSEAFAERMIGILNDAALALMTSIGHRTSLFDVMAGLPPSTSQQIADAPNLNERYVREWLGAMGVDRIVDHDPENETYQCPRSTPLGLPGQPRRITSRSPLSSSRFWARSRMASSKALNTAAGCPTRPSPASTR